MHALAELDDPESLVVPILLDAILMAESYRGARHQVSFLPELTKSVDALLRELTIVEKAKEWRNPETQSTGTASAPGPSPRPR